MTTLETFSASLHPNPLPTLPTLVTRQRGHTTPRNLPANRSPHTRWSPIQILVSLLPAEPFWARNANAFPLSRTTEWTAMSEELSLSRPAMWGTK